MKAAERVVLTVTNVFDPTVFGDNPGHHTTPDRRRHAIPLDAAETAARQSAAMKSSEPTDQMLSLWFFMVPFRGAACASTTEGAPWGRPGPWSAWVGLLGAHHIAPLSMRQAIALEAALIALIHSAAMKSLEPTDHGLLSGLDMGPSFRPGGVTRYEYIAIIDATGQGAMCGLARNMTDIMPGVRPGLSSSWDREMSRFCSRVGSADPLHCQPVRGCSVGPAVGKIGRTGDCTLRELGAAAV